MADASVPEQTRATEYDKNNIPSLVDNKDTRETSAESPFLMIACTHGEADFRSTGYYRDQQAIPEAATPVGKYRNNQQSSRCRDFEAQLTALDAFHSTLGITAKNSAFAGAGKGRRRRFDANGNKSNGN